ncbi:hypothetical protein [Agrococcus sp. Marseille-P2731]|uniref:hypothetical protein n=1 Tax=Agrococcus sp. Marseille-P2731 TaxID=1841862 RepID=UPI0009314980|nr:hypothetical protein [Agrococcus sp. Marseille-P2731]
MTELPWVIDTRAVQRRRNPVWGVLALVGAALSGASFLVSFGIAWVDLDGLVIWLLPVWGVITLLAVAFAVTALVKRGTGNVTMAAIAAGVLVISNPVVFLIIALTVGILQ